MAAITTASPNTSDQQTVFSRDLQKGVAYNLIFASYGRQWKFEENKGTETIRIHRKRAANTDGLNTIARGANEMTTGTTLSEYARGYVEASLAMYNLNAKVSTRQSVLSIFNEIAETVDGMKKDAALINDGIVRDAVIGSGMNGASVWDSATGNIDKHNRFAGVDNSHGAGGSNSTTRFGNFVTAAANSPNNTKWTRLAHLGMLSFLKFQKVPDVNGQYPLLMSPLIYGDLCNDGTIVDTMKYSDPGKMWKGGIGFVTGSPIIQHDNPFTLNNAVSATSVAGGNKFANVYVGKDFFFVPSLNPTKGNISDYRMPSVNILDKADKTDPQNLFTFLAATWWFTAKLFLTSETTDVPHGGVLWTTSTVAQN